MVFWLTCLQSLTLQLCGTAAMEPTSAYMPDWLAGAREGHMDLFSKNCDCVFWPHVAPWGISSRSCLCFILLEHSQDLGGPLNGSCQKYLMAWSTWGWGTTGGQVADRPKSLGRKRRRKEIVGESRVWRAPGRLGKLEGRVHAMASSMTLELVCLADF